MSLSYKTLTIRGRNPTSRALLLRARIDPSAKLWNQLALLYHFTHSEPDTTLEALPTLPTEAEIRQMPASDLLRYFELARHDALLERISRDADATPSSAPLLLPDGVLFPSFFSAWHQELSPLHCELTSDSFAWPINQDDGVFSSVPHLFDEVPPPSLFDDPHLFDDVSPPILFDNDEWSLVELRTSRGVKRSSSEDQPQPPAHRGATRPRVNQLLRARQVKACN